MLDAELVEVEGRLLDKRFVERDPEFAARSARRTNTIDHISSMDYQAIRDYEEEQGILLLTLPDVTSPERAQCVERLDTIRDFLMERTRTLMTRAIV